MKYAVYEVSFVAVDETIRKGFWSTIAFESANKALKRAQSWNSAVVSLVQVATFKTRTAMNAFVDNAIECVA